MRLSDGGVRVPERRMLSKLRAILENISHPLCDVLVIRDSSHHDARLNTA